MPMRRLPVLLVLIGTAHAGPALPVGSPEAKSEATRIALMREGTRTVMTIQADYRGPAERFSLIVPVLSGTTKDNVKALPRDLFDRLDVQTAPRFVELWEQDPCAKPSTLDFASFFDVPTIDDDTEPAAKIEPKPGTGEYEVTIASELRDDLAKKLPPGADATLKGFLDRGMALLVAKVDPSKVTFDHGRAVLSPLRIAFDAPAFALPIQLGAGEPHDLVVYILAKNERYEAANHPNVVVPTNLDLAEPARERFAEAYAALFEKNAPNDTIATEYVWDAGTCGPCTGPTLDANDLALLGASALPNGFDGVRVPRASAAKVRTGPLQVDADYPVEAVRRVLAGQIGRMRTCYESGLQLNPKLEATVTVKLKIGFDGKPSDVSVAGGEIRPAVVRSCIGSTIDSLRFPPPANGPADLTFPLVLGSRADAGVPISPEPRVAFGPTPYVITRLHTRLPKDDLQLRPAPPIVGGREQRIDGTLEAGSRQGKKNAFQARYVIRHPWNGPVSCSSPRRNVYAGPPLKVPAPAQPPIVAQKLAFVPRGNMDPASVFLAPAAPPPPRDASAEPAPAPKAKSGCSATPAHPLPANTRGPQTGKGEPLLLLALALAFVRRRLIR
jgi:hypothetical protein